MEATLNYFSNTFYVNNSFLFLFSPLFYILKLKHKQHIYIYLYIYNLKYIDIYRYIDI